VRQCTTMGDVGGGGAGGGVSDGSGAVQPPGLFVIGLSFSRAMMPARRSQRKMSRGGLT
jgi:hypothetical protein